jgi:hypothetical protein
LFSLIVSPNSVLPTELVGILTDGASCGEVQRCYVHSSRCTTPLFKAMLAAAAILFVSVVCDLKRLTWPLSRGGWRLRMSRTLDHR